MQKPAELQLQLPGSSITRTPVSVPLGELRFHNREFVRVAGVAALRQRRLALYSSLDARVPMQQLNPSQLWDLWPDVDVWNRDVSAWLNHCVVIDGIYRGPREGPRGTEDGSFELVTRLAAWSEPYRATPRRDSAPDRDPRHLNPAIPPYDDSSVYSLFRGRWPNPELAVLSDRVELTAAGEVTSVSIANLQPALVGLPVSAWPYGRVIRMRTQCLGPVNPDHEILERKVRKNSQIVEETLRVLRISIDGISC